MEISRKRVTGSKTDVQFDDLGAAYPFDLSVFDNAQVRHAYVQKPMTLIFQKWRTAGWRGPVLVTLAAHCQCMVATMVIHCLGVPIADVPGRQAHWKGNGRRGGRRVSSEMIWRLRTGVRSLNRSEAPA